MHNPVTLKDTDTMTLQDALYYQNVDYILTIPEGFEEQLTDSDARDFLPGWLEYSQHLDNKGHPVRS